MELPGYRTVFNGAVYSKGRTEERVGAVIMARNLMDVLVMKRFKWPSEDEVVQYLTQRAEEAEAFFELSSQGCMLNGCGTPIDEIMYSLNPTTRRNMAAGHDGITDLIRRLVRSRSYSHADNRYVELVLGSLPTEYVESCTQAGLVKTRSWYENVLNDRILRGMGLGKKWKAQVRHNGSLPDRDEVDTLLRHETSSSSTLQVKSFPYPREEVGEALAALYQGLATGSLDEIPDISGKQLERMAQKVMRLLITVESFNSEEGITES
jgi:hypothetical protein